MTNIEKAANEYVTSKIWETHYRADDDVRKAFLAGAEAARPKWIKCSERLPDYNKQEWMFCYFKGVPGLRHGDESIRLACWHPGRKKFECAYLGEVIEDYCTHWMPLPEAPEGEE